MITPSLHSVPDTFVTLAHSMAEVSGVILRRYFRRSITVNIKPDASPVTVADREVECALRDILHRTVPTHGIIGEEYGTENATAEWVWVIDPIDGTKAFITGKPSFGTLIGLAWQGQPALGVIDQPITAERWIGGKGMSAILNGKRIRVRLCNRLKKAYLYTTDPDMFSYTSVRQAAWKRLEQSVKLRRFGADCYAYGLLAAGFIDLVYECQLSVHDHLPVTAVIEAAGGIVTNHIGQPAGLLSNVCILAAGDRRLHKQALTLLNTKI